MKLKLFTSLVSVTTISTLFLPAYADSSNLLPFSSSSVAQSQPLMEQVFRLEESLPKSVANAVLRKASDQWDLPFSQLQIISAQPKTWLDGCLGLGNFEKPCTQVVISGWQITVQQIKSNHTWVYRTDASGFLVKFEQSIEISPIDDSPLDNPPPLDVKLSPVQIPKDELPPPLPQGAIFRAITAGGLAAFSYETILQADGQVINITENRITNEATASEVCQLSAEELKQFQQLVENPQFIRLNGLGYPEPNGAADFSTITFSNQSSTVRYSDAVIKKNLPQLLQDVIQAWNQVTNCTEG